MSHCFKVRDVSPIRARILVSHRNGTLPAYLAISWMKSLQWDE